MKRSLTALCLLLCLAATAAAQDANANTNPLTIEVRPGQTAKITVGKQGDAGGGISQQTKDVIDIISKLGTPVSILIALFLALQQVKKNRDDREKDRRQREDAVTQRKDELRWRKSQLARELLKGLYDDPYATDMMTMLDWGDREFCVKSSRSRQGEFHKISWADLWAALRVTELDYFNDKEKFIRDCADAFFSRMQTLEHYLAIGLIEMEDVVYPFDYYLYADPISDNRPVFDNFIKRYHPRAEQFVKRFEAYEAQKEAASTPADAPPSTPAEEAPSAPAGEVSPTPEEVESGAYFLFDCPPREERFVLLLKDESKIGQAQKILKREAWGHVDGQLIDSAEYYTDPWRFHVEPASVDFPLEALDFAEKVNQLVEAQLGVTKKAAFKPDAVWHTRGARLLTQLPWSWFEQERDWRRNEQKATLRAQGRVDDAASAGAGGQSRE